MSNLVAAMELEGISFDGYKASINKTQTCIGCGISLETGSYKGPKDKSTCSYSCYRLVWTFKDTIFKVIDNQPGFAAYVMAMINHGICFETIKSEYKKAKKNKFEGPYDWKLVK